MYKVMMAQISLMAKDKSVPDSAGFSRIMSLLSELIDTTQSDVDAATKEVNKTQLACQVEDSGQNSTISKLQDMLDKHSSDLKNMQTEAQIRQIIANLTNKKNSTRRDRDVYIQTYALVTKEYNQFQSLYKAILPDLNSSIKDLGDLNKIALSKTKDVTNAQLILTDLGFSDKKYSPNVKDIAELDDTSECTYKDALLTNLKKAVLNQVGHDLPSSSDLIDIMAAANNILRTLGDFKDHMEEKMSHYKSYNKTLFQMNQNIHDMETLLNQWINNHLKNYQTIHDSLVSSISNDGKALSLATSAKATMNANCVARINALISRMKRGNSELISFQKLKTFFMTNYSKISASMKAKYAGSGSVSVQAKK